MGGAPASPACGPRAGQWFPVWKGADAENRAHAPRCLVVEIQARQTSSMHGQIINTSGFVGHSASYHHSTRPLCRENNTQMRESERGSEKILLSGTEL